MECEICPSPAITNVGEVAFCIRHLHDWMLSKEGMTAKRLFGLDSHEAHKEHRIHALLKLFLDRTRAEGVDLTI